MQIKGRDGGRGSSLIFVPLPSCFAVIWKCPFLINTTQFIPSNDSISIALPKNHTTGGYDVGFEPG